MDMYMQGGKGFLCQVHVRYTLTNQACLPSMHGKFLSIQVAGRSLSAAGFVQIR